MQLLTAKLLRIMKITAIILLSACLTASAKSNGQQVTLSVKDAPLSDVFRQIRKQTGYNFLYNDAWLADAKKVSLSVSKASLTEALDLCFKGQPFSYTIIEKTIALKPAPVQLVQPVVTAPTEPLLPPVIDISGRITDPDGNPLVGATVTVKGTKTATKTDANGVFTLKQVDENATLEITNAEFLPIIVKVDNRTSITIVMKRAETTLNEVIINKGYYKTNKITEVGNVSSVTAKDIEKQPVNNPLLALQGRVPGLIVTPANGLANSGVKVQIRGQNSLAYGNLPLYIVDGVPYTSENLPNIGYNILGAGGQDGTRGGNPLSYLNPSDIESIDVLKDADATAIYGSRGASGVILITTKKGKSGKMKFDVNAQTGFAKVPKKIELLNRRQYLDMRYEAFANDGVTTIPSTAFDLKSWDTTRYTDWQKEFIGGTAQYNDLQASVYGGNTNTQYLVGGGYHRETTVFPGDFSNQLASLHLNLNSTSSNQKLRFLLSSNYSVNDNHILSNDFTGIALTLAPVAPNVYNADGSFNWANSTWNNPLATYLSRKYKSQTNNLIANTTISYQIVKDLEIKSSFGYTNMQTNEVATDPSLSTDPAFWASRGTSLRSANFVNNRITSWIMEPQINYRKELGKGQLSVILGSTIHQTKSNGQPISAQGYNSDLQLEDPKAASIVTLGATVYSLYRYNAVFGRIGYNWEEKYLLNLTARRDGSSRFGPENRFHNFGAVGVGWVFSKEKFINKNFKFLSSGKLRTSIGTTGNDQVGDYTFLDLYSTTSGSAPYQGTTGLQLSRHYSPDLAWEETKKIEGGLELGFLKDRIIMSISHYINTSSNQLTGYTLPSFTGFSSVTKNLNARVENKGWEITFNTINLNSKSIKWTSSFNVYWNRNKLTQVDSNMSQTFYKSRVGLPIGSFNLYKYSGVNSSTGLYEFLDKNGTAVSNPVFGPNADMYVLANPTPKFSGGFQNSIQYKSLQLDIFFYFVKQKGYNYLYNLVPGYWNSGGLGNQPITVLDRWRKPGDVTNIQRFNQDLNAYDPYDYSLQSDRSFTDISFIKLKNLSLSWNIPKVWNEKIHLQSSRLFVQGQNLFTITKYKGFDPETASATSLPPLRTIAFGVQIVL